jgi:flagellin
LISLIQTAEGALNETHAILQRMRELAVQASNDTYTATDRSEIQKEMNQLIDEIDRIAETTQFNEQNLLDGTFNEKVFHIGANTGQDIKLSINAMGSGAAASVLTQGTADVKGVTGATVLKDGDGNVVAVQADDGSGTNKWYNVDDVEEDSGSLKASTGAEELNITEGRTIGGEGFYTQGTADVKGVTGATVLKDGDGNVIAVQVDDGSSTNKWYNVDDVEEVSGSLKASTGATELTVATVYQHGDSDSGGGLGVASLKVDNVTKDSTGGIMTQEGASQAITTIQSAIELVSAERSKLGAYQNRLEHTINNLSTSSENLTAAESRIRDVDYALAV